MLTFKEILILGIVIPNILQFSYCFRYLIQFNNFVLQSNAFINDFVLTYQILQDQFSSESMHFLHLLNWFFLQDEHWRQIRIKKDTLSSSWIQNSDKMEKYFMLLALAVTAVLGQQDPQYSYIDRPIYRPQNEPDPYAQERAYLDYDYSSVSEEDYPVPSQSVNRNRARPQPQGPPTNINTFYQTDCKAKERTLPHEKYCDHFYQLNGCDDDQAILRACPNGLVYTGNGRHGLIGVCDYPHRADCNGRERHSK